MEKSNSTESSNACKTLLANRLFKFRVWDNDSHQMFDWHKIKDIGLCEFQNKYYNLMQFTGLKDKDGKEIYEGDFIKLSDDYRGHGEKPSYVFYENGNWMTQGIMNYTHKYKLFGFSLSDMEVIGNIFENPELLAYSN